MKKLRTFVAINLPLVMVRQIALFQAKLRVLAHERGIRVAWVPPHNMHVTLKFLGDIAEENIGILQDRLQERLSGRSPILFRVKGVGAFPSPTKPRILWIGLSSEYDALSALARDIDGGLAELGFVPEERPFHPHLTLGRVKQGEGDILTEMEPVDFGDVICKEILLFQSVLSSKGPEYHALAHFPLDLHIEEVAQMTKDRSSQEYEEDILEMLPEEEEVFSSKDSTFDEASDDADLIPP